MARDAQACGAIRGQEMSQKTGERGPQAMMTINRLDQREWVHETISSSLDYADAESENARQSR